MAEIKYSLPKARVACRQRKGRRRTVAMAPASLNGPIVGLEEKEQDGEDVEWCKECLNRGERNAVSYLQISDELAVLVCNDELCTSLPTLAPGSQLVVERRAADIIQCRRRKRRATSLPKLDPTNPQSQQLEGPMSATVSPLPPSGAVQWRNEGKMCWMDVCMLLLVQFRSLRQCHQALGATSPLRKLCDGFDSVQSIAAAVVEATKQNMSLQAKSNNPASVKKPADASDLETLSAYLGNDLLGAGESHDLVDNKLLSDHFLDFINGKLPNNVCDTSAHSEDERHSGPVPTDSNSSLPAKTTSDEQSSPLLDTSTEKLAAAVESLRILRKELLEMLKPRLGCQENKEDCPISAIPTLLRLDGAIEEHFTVRYRREFYCFSCGFANVSIHRSAILTLTSTSSDFSMQNPTMHHPCPQCKAPGQTSRLIYHSLPACPLIHFINGVGNTKDLPWLQPDFSHRGQQYHLSCIIQYSHNPNHFVIWIRDPSREQWMKCDGLSSPVCLWQSQEPSIPPSEVHLVGWERQNSDCYSCLELQQQMIHIQETALEGEDDPVCRKADKAVIASTDCDAPQRKRSCPVVVGRSASPLTTSYSTWPSRTQAARSLSPQPTKPLPASSILSIGTPPQSPEFQMPKTSVSSEPKDSIPTDTCSKIQETGKRRGGALKQWTQSDRETSKGNRWERAVSAAKSEKQGHESNRRSVASYLLSKMKNSQKPPGVLTGLLGNFPRSFTKQQQDADEEADARPAGYNPITRNFSVLQTLRSLNVNATLPKKDTSAAVQGKKAEKKPVPRTKSVMEKGGAVIPSVPKKVQKVRIPRQKIDSFSAFKEKSSNLFSGYLKQKDPTTEDIHTNRKDSRSQNNASQMQEGDFQSSALLTPSSSVSSPSACSDASLQSENLPAGGSDDREIENLSNTMDALCKALDVASNGVPQTVVSQPLANVDDDSFLQGLLR